MQQQPPPWDRHLQGPEPQRAFGKPVAPILPPHRFWHCASVVEGLTEAGRVEVAALIRAIAPSWAATRRTRFALAVKSARLTPNAELFQGDPRRTNCYGWVRRSRMDNPHDHRTDDDAPATPSEAHLLAVMEQSDRDLAAALTVPLADVLAELEGVAKEIEARRRARRA